MLKATGKKVAIPMFVTEFMSLSALDPLVSPRFATVSSDADLEVLVMCPCSSAGDRQLIHSARKQSHKNGPEK